MYTKPYLAFVLGKISIVVSNDKSNQAYSWPSHQDPDICGHHWKPCWREGATLLMMSIQKQKSCI